MLLVKSLNGQTFLEKIFFGFEESVKKIWPSFLFRIMRKT